MGRTAPIELPPRPTPPPPQPPSTTPVAPTEPVPDGEIVAPEAPPEPPAADELAPPVAAAISAPSQQDVVYVPLAITIGDGFKFGCGFFLAFVLAALVGFVLLAALFLLTSLFGLNLPITR